MLPRGILTLAYRGLYALLWQKPDHDLRQRLFYLIQKYVYDLRTSYIIGRGWVVGRGAAERRKAFVALA